MLSAITAGRLKVAEQIYRQVLAIDTDADSLHLLGMVAYRQGCYPFAVARIEEQSHSAETTAPTTATWGAAL